MSGPAWKESALLTVEELEETDGTSEANKRVMIEAAEVVKGLVARIERLTDADLIERRKFISRMLEVRAALSSQDVQSAARLWVQMSRPNIDSSPAAVKVLDERIRQITDEGFTPEHDREHGPDYFVHAARCYLTHVLGFRAQYDSPGDMMGGQVQYRRVEPTGEWPMEREWFKPKNPPTDLIRAAALLAAAVDVMQPKGY